MSKSRCSVEGCEAPARSRGWCGKHYQRWRSTGDPTRTRSGQARDHTPRSAACEHCSVTFEPKPHSRAGWTRFCSRSCARKAQLADGSHAWMKSGAWTPAPTEAERRERRALQGERARRKRRARLAGADSEPYTLAQIAERDGFRCGICGRRVDMSLKYPHSRSASIDHIVPLSKGGADTKANIRLAHLGENVGRGNRTSGYEQMLLVG